LFARYRHAVAHHILAEFHENNALLFEFYHSQLSKKLDADRQNYFALMKQIMTKPPPSEEIYRFFTKLIGDQKQILEKYKKNKVRFETLKEVARILIKDTRLLDQTFFTPYPEELVADVEEERGRDYWEKK
jgi:hypothetical protein